MPAQGCDLADAQALRPSAEPSRPSHARPMARDLASSESHDRVWLALAVSLSLAGITAKLLLLPFPVTTAGELVRWLLRLGIVVSPDVCFAVGLASICWLISLPLRTWPTAVQRTWRTICLGSFGLCAVYAIASVPMYKVTKVPFTVRLLSFVGGPEVMLSSAGEYFPPGIVALLVVSPLVVVLSPWAARRHGLRRVLAPIGPKATAALVVGVALGGGLCQRYVQVRADWADPNRWERRIAQSPHWVLVASCLTELSKDRPFTQNFAFDEIDESDFRGPPPITPAEPLLPADRRPKNVILIVLESIAAEYWGLQGSRFATTPNLDRLAAERGVVFDNIYSQAASSCKSLLAISNSVYDRPDWLLVVRDHPAFDVPALPQVLRERGYRTCYAHSGHWGWQRREQYLEEHGAETLIDAKDMGDAKINSWGSSDQAMFAEILGWIDTNPDRPFFAYAYTIETHHPYVAPPEHHDFGVRDEELARYLDAVRGADAKIAWLYAELRKRGLADSTLLAVTADHGESFGQHNLRTHSFGVYEQAVHVPLVLLHPGLRDLPRRRSNVGCHIDLAPTLLDILNIPAPEAWQGRCLLRDETDHPAYFLSVGNEVVLGLRDGRFKYHFYVDTLHEELFDLEADAGENDNLAAHDPQRARGYRSRLGGWVTSQREFLAQHGVR
ncbi:MAG TPA: LTA synthase family protein [Pirellulales bacterium]|nr:LTA synthase family protein [Pirellulales bacterium]